MQEKASLHIGKAGRCKISRDLFNWSDNKCFAKNVQYKSNYDSPKTEFQCYQNTDSY